MFSLIDPPVGQAHPRADRLVHNGRWHLLTGSSFDKIGWGDVSLADLADIAGQVGQGLFLAIAEQADFAHDGDIRWGHYDQMGGHRPLLKPAAIAAQVRFAVTGNGGVLEHRRGTAVDSGTVEDYGPTTPTVVHAISTSDLTCLIETQLSGTGRPPAC